MFKLASEIIKEAYTYHELKPLLQRVHKEFGEKGLEFLRSKAMKSGYLPEKGIVIQKARKGEPDRSIPDFLHEYFHYDHGHTGFAIGPGMKPTKQAIKQEFEANRDAILLMKNTKGKQRRDQMEYLIKRQESYEK